MERKKETEHVPCDGKLQDVLRWFDLVGKFPSIPESGYQVNFEEVPIFQELRN